MPHRNLIRIFIADHSYHCYNRGVERRKIFLDAQDYGVFLNRLKRLLANPDELKDEEPGRDRLRSFHGEIELVAYCLMPNHYHLLLKQVNETALAEFMRSLSTSYTMYFNKRYQRVGPLFQGRYKARLVDTDAYDLHLSRYIHLNPIDLPADFHTYDYSSFRFLKDPHTRPSWLHVDRVLGAHDYSYDVYEKFVAEYANTGKFERLSDEFDLL